MTLLEHAAIFLVTAVIVVPVFRRMQLGAVLGYLAAGAIIGPWGLGLIADADATLSFAEMGVVLLLFLIGLELEPSRLWALRQPVFGLGGAQVVVTGIVLTGIAVWLNLSWQAAIVVGLGLAMSSTAIVLAWLGERGQLSSPSGRLAFAILLFQDVAVIPLIALLPLLSPDKTGHPSGWILAAKGVAAIAFVIVVSRLLVRPGAEARRALRRPRGVHRRGIAGRDRSGADDGNDGPLDVAGRVPRRRAARRFGIPPRARGRRRAVQGSAARAVLHGGGDERQSRALRVASVHSARRGARFDGAESAAHVRRWRECPGRAAKKRSASPY